MTKKIAVIGGGAYGWVPDFIQDLVLHPFWKGSQVCLMDLSIERVELTGRLCDKIVATAKADLHVTRTLDRDQALTGADIVLVCINTGGVAAHDADTRVPLKYGIRSSVGDTAGPSGISRSLRNVPVVADIAQRVAAVAPRAWLVNVTNPMGTLTRAMRMQHGRTVGYCHEIEWLRLRVAHRFGLPREQVQATTVGVNHMTWVTQLRIGDDPHGLERLAEDVAKRGPLNDQGKPTPVVQELYELYGAVPTSLDSHIAEFYAPYAAAEIADRYGLPQYTGQMEETNVQQRNKKRVEGRLSGELPITLEHSMEQLSPIAAALCGAGPFVGIGNLPNVGQVDNLPRGTVLETAVLYDHDSAHALAMGPLRPALVSSLIQHCYAQDLTVQAALSGDRRLLIEALLTQPHIRDFAVVSQMADDMLEANRKYLPRFFE